jgi:hypothetical protein
MRTHIYCFLFKKLGGNIWVGMSMVGREKILYMVGAPSLSAVAYIERISDRLFDSILIAMLYDDLARD